MKLISAVLARNEADRYLARVLDRLLQFSDHILLLDDHSADQTIEVAQSYGCLVQSRNGSGPMWGQERAARAELWAWASQVAEDGWVLICDADQILYGDIRPLMESWICNAWAFPLYDCWDQEQQYRADGYWQGYQLARPWFFCPSRVPDGYVPVWDREGLHTGHCPSNFPLACGSAPADIYWQHLGWLTLSDRNEKYQRYMAHQQHLTAFELAHLESVHP